MTQYSLPFQDPVTSTTSWGFIGTPPVKTFTDSNTAAEVIVQEDILYNSTGTGALVADFGICYQPSPANGAPVSMASFTGTTLNPGQGNIYPVTVSGVISGLTGSYSVGACAKDETTNMSNDSGYETITMAETTSG